MLSKTQINNIAVGNTITFFADSIDEWVTSKVTSIRITSINTKLFVVEKMDYAKNNLSAFASEVVEVI